MLFIVGVLGGLVYGLVEVLTFHGVRIAVGVIIGTWRQGKRIATALPSKTT